MSLATVNCGICDAITVNGYVCSKCEVKLRSLIDRAGITTDDGLCILDELDLQMSRQSRSGSRNGSRSTETSIPFDARAAKAHAVLSDVLTSWARHYGARDSALAGPRRSAYWLRMHLADIMTSADAALMYQDLDRATVSAERIMERPEPRTYIGICSALTLSGVCDLDLYAVRGAGSLICRQCGTVHDVEARRHVMLSSAQEMLLSAVDTVRIVSTYGGHVTSGQIYKWRFRGRLTSPARNAEGHPLYRLGDVLQLAGHEPLHLQGMEG